MASIKEREQRRREAGLTVAELTERKAQLEEAVAQSALEVCVCVLFVCVCVCVCVCLSVCLSVHLRLYVHRVTLRLTADLSRQLFFLFVL